MDTAGKKSRWMTILRMMSAVSRAFLALSLTQEHLHSTFMIDEAIVSEERNVHDTKTGVSSLLSHATMPAVLTGVLSFASHFRQVSMSHIMSINASAKAELYRSVATLKCCGSPGTRPGFGA